LTLNRRIHRAYNRVREHNFSLTGLIGFDLSGKTIGVIGTGKIGKIAAQIFRGFNMRALAYDPFPAPEWAAQQGVQYTDLNTLLRESDVVTLHLPLSPATNHLLNAERFALMKRGAMLINTSRGKLVDTPALIHSLLEGHLGGVALDVYEEEEGIFFEDHSDHLLQDDILSRLLTFPNVLITSHQAFRRFWKARSYSVNRSSIASPRFPSRLWSRNGPLRAGRQRSARRRDKNSDHRAPWPGALSMFVRCRCFV
jgi:D-lactate dehydrogenase